MIPHLELSKGKKKYILIRDGEVFHILNADDALTAQKRKLLLERCMTREEMQEMGMSGATVAVSDLQGIAVYGCATGDDLEFHFGKKKWCYTLARRYETGFLDQFFQGVPRIRIPPRRKMKGSRHRDWRINEQIPQVRKVMKWVSLGINLGSILLLVSMIFLDVRMFEIWSLVVMLWTLITVFLGVGFQEYFVWVTSQAFGKRKGSAKVYQLWLGLMPAAAMTMRAFSSFLFMDFLQPFGYALVAGLIVGLILILLCADLRENVGHAAGSVAVSVFLCMGIAVLGNHLLAQEEFVYHELPVVEKQFVNHSKGADDYNCTVRFPDGREVTVDVGKKTFDRYEVGDILILPVRTGALGMEYAYYGYGE